MMFQDEIVVFKCADIWVQPEKSENISKKIPEITETEEVMVISVFPR